MVTPLPSAVSNTLRCPRLPDASAYPPIRDYALIGDCRTAALVSISGSIDWLCWPRFDSTSFFNRLLNWEQGGYCAIQPAARYQSRRSYQQDTAILETHFHTADGHVRLTDLMPVVPQEDQPRLLPLRQVLRRVEGLEGSVEMVVVVKPRPENGRTPIFHRRTAQVYCADLGGEAFLVGADAPLRMEEGALVARILVGRGQSMSLWITYEEGPAVYPCLAEASRVIRETADYWRGWTQRCSYAGPYRSRVVRSALTLKLLTYAPSGAIVAAPTTSLPEQIGGPWNWDYRYCWLRDASLSARVFYRLGFDQEASAFMQWVSHATTLTYPDLQVMYDVHGEASLPERTLNAFEGYRQSRPVRVGNAASSQFQLDIYGELLEGLLAYAETGHRMDWDTRRWIVRIGDLITERWSRADHGIWECRDAPRHYVHSKVMCWVALDRAGRLARMAGLSASTAAWAQARQLIQRVVLAAGFSRTRRSFVQVLGGGHVDAAALLFSAAGFIDGRDARMTSTIATIQRVLGKGPFLYRYLREGELGQEGAFVPCSFWLAEALILAGRVEQGQALIEELQDAANDVGLLPEEVRPEDGLALGNCPLALTHVGHLSAVLRLHQGR